jgi:hypothetical protein
MTLTIALAGRRIDAADAEAPRFPLANTALVRERLHALFAQRRTSTLVCSAACGADLVALEAAEFLGMRRRIVLPFALERFRKTSVTDRPGDWGPLYDRTIEVVRRAGDLIVLEGAGEGDLAYQAANERILDEAVALVSAGLASNSVLADAALAVIVWEGSPRGSDDATQHFAQGARQRGLGVEPILTL